MTNWLDELLASGKSDTAAGRRGCVLVSVVRTRGSCPRDAGTRMLVMPDRCIDTIGGGHLEYSAIALARALLATGDAVYRIERFALGARLGQCCGGVAHLSFDVMPGDVPVWAAELADLGKRGESAVLVSPLADAEGKLIVTSAAVAGRWPDCALQRSCVEHAQTMLGDPDKPAVDWQQSVVYERIEPLCFHIAIFGAGHVGKALVQVLATLPCRIDWIDGRAAEFPVCSAENVTMHLSDHPEDEVGDLPAGSHAVIMTHSHALDQLIVEAVLRRNDLAWCGLIGSHTKRALFERRLLARGLDARVLARLTCPIGVAGIEGKHPAQIAIAVAAELLQSR